MDNLEQNLGTKNMNLKEGELLFNHTSMKRSKRVLEVDELISLISEGRGISRKALMLLTGNMLRNNLQDLETTKKVKVKEVAEISYRKPQKVYYTAKKLSITAVKQMELLSYGVWYLREKGLKIGRITTKEDGNLIATAVIDNNTYSILEFVGLNQRNYIRKLASVDLSGQKTIYQTVLVIDSRELMLEINEHYDLSKSLVILKQDIGTAKILRGFEHSKVIQNGYDFTNLKVIKGNREVERVMESYYRLDKLSKKFK